MAEAASLERDFSEADGYKVVTALALHLDSTHRTFDTLQALSFLGRLGALCFPPPSEQVHAGSTGNSAGLGQSALGYGALGQIVKSLLLVYASTATSEAQLQTVETITELFSDHRSSAYWRIKTQGVPVFDMLFKGYNQKSTRVQVAVAGLLDVIVRSYYRGPSFLSAPHSNVHLTPSPAPSGGPAPNFDSIMQENMQSAVASGGNECDSEHFPGRSHRESLGMHRAASTQGQSLREELELVCNVLLAESVGPSAVLALIQHCLLATGECPEYARDLCDSGILPALLLRYCCTPLQLPFAHCMQEVSVQYECTGLLLSFYRATMGHAAGLTVPLPRIPETLRSQQASAVLVDMAGSYLLVTVTLQVITLLARLIAGSDDRQQLFVTCGGLGRLQGLLGDEALRHGVISLLGELAHNPTHSPTVVAALMDTVWDPTPKPAVDTSNAQENSASIKARCKQLHWAAIIRALSRALHGEGLAGHKARASFLAHDGILWFERVLAMVVEPATAYTGSKEEWDATTLSVVEDLLDLCALATSSERSVGDAIDWDSLYAALVRTGLMHTPYATDLCCAMLRLAVKGPLPAECTDHREKVADYPLAVRLLLQRLCNTSIVTDSLLLHLDCMFADCMRCPTLCDSFSRYVETNPGSQSNTVSNGSGALGMVRTASLPPMGATVPPKSDSPFTTHPSVPGDLVPTSMHCWLAIDALMEDLESLRATDQGVMPNPLLCDHQAHIWTRASEIHDTYLRGGAPGTLGDQVVNRAARFAIEGLLGAYAPGYSKPQAGKSPKPNPPSNMNATRNGSNLRDMRSASALQIPWRRNARASSPDISAGKDRRWNSMSHYVSDDLSMMRLGGPVDPEAGKMKALGHLSQQLRQVQREVYSRVLARPFAKFMWREATTYTLIPPLAYIKSTSSASADSANSGPTNAQPQGKHSHSKEKSSRQHTIGSPDGPAVCSRCEECLRVVRLPAYTIVLRLLKQALDEERERTEVQPTTLGSNQLPNPGPGPPKTAKEIYALSPDCVRDSVVLVLGCLTSLCRDSRKDIPMLNRGGNSGGWWGNLPALCAAGTVGLVLDLFSNSLKNDKHFAHPYALLLLETLASYSLEPADLRRWLKLLSGPIFPVCLPQSLGRVGYNHRLTPSHFVDFVGSLRPAPQGLGDESMPTADGPLPGALSAHNSPVHWLLPPPSMAGGLTNLPETSTQEGGLAGACIQRLLLLHGYGHRVEGAQGGGVLKMRVARRTYQQAAPGGLVFQLAGDAQWPPPINGYTVHFWVQRLPPSPASDEKNCPDGQHTSPLIRLSPVVGKFEVSILFQGPQLLVQAMGDRAVCPHVFTASTWHHVVVAHHRHSNTKGEVVVYVDGTRRGDPQQLAYSRPASSALLMAVGNALHVETCGACSHQGVSIGNVTVFQHHAATAQEALALYALGPDAGQKLPNCPQDFFTMELAGLDIPERADKNVILGQLLNPKHDSMPTGKLVPLREKMLAHFSAETRAVAQPPQLLAQTTSGRSVGASGENQGEDGGVGGNEDCMWLQGEYVGEEGCAVAHSRHNMQDAVLGCGGMESLLMLLAKTGRRASGTVAGGAAGTSASTGQGGGAKGTVGGVDDYDVHIHPRASHVCNWSRQAGSPHHSWLLGPGAVLALVMEALAWHPTNATALGEIYGYHMLGRLFRTIPLHVSLVQIVVAAMCTVPSTPMANSTDPLTRTTRPRLAVSGCLIKNRHLLKHVGLQFGVWLADGEACLLLATALADMASPTHAHALFNSTQLRRAGAFSRLLVLFEHHRVHVSALTSALVALLFSLLHTYPYGPDTVPILVEECTLLYGLLAATSASVTAQPECKDGSLPVREEILRRLHELLESAPQHAVETLCVRVFPPGRLVALLGPREGIAENIHVVRIMDLLMRRTHGSSYPFRWEYIRMDGYDLLPFRLRHCVPSAPLLDACADMAVAGAALGEIRMKIHGKMHAQPLTEMYRRALVPCKRGTLLLNGKLRYWLSFHFCTCCPMHVPNRGVWAHGHQLLLRLFQSAGAVRRVLLDHGFIDTLAKCVVAKVLDAELLDEQGLLDQRTSCTTQARAQYEECLSMLSDTVDVCKGVGIMACVGQATSFSVFAQLLGALERATIECTQQSLSEDVRQKRWHRLLLVRQAILVACLVHFHTQLQPTDYQQDGGLADRYRSLAQQAADSIVWMPDTADTTPLPNSAEGLSSAQVLGKTVVSNVLVLLAELIDMAVRPGLYASPMAAAQEAAREQLGRLCMYTLPPTQCRQIREFVILQLANNKRLLRMFGHCAEVNTCVLYYTYLFHEEHRQAHRLNSDCTACEAAVSVCTQLLTDEHTRLTEELLEVDKCVIPQGPASQLSLLDGNGSPPELTLTFQSHVPVTIIQWRGLEIRAHGFQTQEHKAVLEKTREFEHLVVGRLAAADAQFVGLLAQAQAYTATHISAITTLQAETEKKGMRAWAKLLDRANHPHHFWSARVVPVTWRLDPTEGPSRTCGRLKPWKFMPLLPVPADTRSLLESIESQLATKSDADGLDIVDITERNWEVPKLQRELIRQANFEILRTLRWVAVQRLSPDDALHLYRTIIHDLPPALPADYGPTTWEAVYHSHSYTPTYATGPGQRQPIDRISSVPTRTTTNFAVSSDGLASFSLGTVQEEDPPPVPTVISQQPEDTYHPPNQNAGTYAPPISIGWPGAIGDSGLEGLAIAQKGMQKRNSQASTQSADVAGPGPLSSLGQMLDARAGDSPGRGSAGRPKSLMDPKSAPMQMETSHHRSSTPEPTRKPPKTDVPHRPSMQSRGNLQTEQGLAQRRDSLMQSMPMLTVSRADGGDADTLLSQSLPHRHTLVVQHGPVILDSQLAGLIAHPQFLQWYEEDARQLAALEAQPAKTTHTDQPLSLPESDSRLSITEGGDLDQDVVSADYLKITWDDIEDMELLAHQRDALYQHLEVGEQYVHAQPCTRLTVSKACKGYLLVATHNIYFIDASLQPGTAFASGADSQRGPYANLNDMLPVQENTHKLEVDPTLFGCEGAEDLPQPYVWPARDVLFIHERRYMLQDRALEVFLTSGKTYLLAFQTRTRRDAAFAKLMSLHMPNFVNFWDEVNGGLLRKSITERWCSGQMSNFEYLMHLNNLAGRSCSDLTQYPVFPWVLADYTSPELDLTNPSTFRDLSKPMGAQSPDRLGRFLAKYETLVELGAEGGPGGEGEGQAYHYGSHYSNMGAVLHFLVRLQPYTQHFVNFQGGRFDLPDRTFHSVAQSWLLSSSLSTSDVKELIPEFFYLPEFLRNINSCQFGTKQDGQLVSDVVLPPWARNNPRLFIMRHRQALESRYVSDNLHQWIDLIFGYKQSGRAAVQAHNLFHPLTYEGAVVLDGMEDEVRRQAVLTQIRTYGQTPKKLFTRPHPGMQYARQPMFVDVPFGLGAGQLKDTVVGAVYEASPMVPPHSLPCVDGILYPLGPRRLLLPDTGRVVSWGHSEGVVWVEAQESGERLWGLEHAVWAHEPPVCFAGGLADPCLLVSGGCDGAVCVWRLAPQLMETPPTAGLPADPRRHARRHDYAQAQESTGRNPVNGGQAGGMHLLTTLHAHSDAVLCATVSRAFSVFATGGRDGLCVLWDLNRLRYVRALDDHEGAVTSVAICPTSGAIATVCDLPIDGGWSRPASGSFCFYAEGAVPSNPFLAGSKRLANSATRNSQGGRARDSLCNVVRLWTINGAPVGRASSVDRGRATCVSFSSMPEGRYVNVLVGGFTSGQVCVWSTLDMALVLCVEACPTPSCGVTGVAVSTDGQMLIVGDESGRVTWWTGPEQKKQLRSALWGSKPAVVVGKRDRVRGSTFAVRKADSA